MVQTAWILAVLLSVGGCSADWLDDLLDDESDAEKETEEEAPGPPEVSVLASSAPQVAESVEAVRTLLGFLAAVDSSGISEGLLEIEGSQFRVQISEDGTLSWPGPGVTLTAIGDRNAGGSVTIGPVDPVIGLFPEQPSVPLAIVIGSLVRAVQWPSGWPADEHWTIEAEDQDGRIVGRWSRWAGEYEIARADLR
jgi:hypothetical protein